MLTWSNAGFSLQSSPFPNSAYTNVPGATNPFTAPIDALRRYFRLKGP